MSIEERLARIEKSIEQITREIGYIRGRINSEIIIVKYVVFPMIVIMAGLVGIKLVLP